MARALTVAAVEHAKASTARREIADGLISGLYLVVQPSGAKAWAVRYRINGKTRKLTLGSYPAVELGSARTLARKALLSVAEGTDPGHAKLARRERPIDQDLQTFGDVAKEFVARYAKVNNRPATWREIERLLTKQVAVWRNRPMVSILRGDVMNLLDAIVDRNKPVLANRTFGAIRRVFNWAIDRGIVENSPCENVKPPAVERSRDRVLNDDELRFVWNAADVDGWPFGSLVQLLVLTGQRRDEVSEAKWSEFDFTKRVWILPRDRVKNDALHEVPLSDQAIRLLNKLPVVSGGSKFVFTTNGRTSVTGFSRAKKRLDKSVFEAMRDAASARGEDPRKIENLERWTLHDLRRTVASGMARLGVGLPTIEKVLNHTSGSFGGIVGVYQRHSFAEEKKTALAAWGRFVEELVK